MPTIIAHAAVGWSLARLGTATADERAARRVPDVAALLAMLPDADVVGFRLGVNYGDLLGHRGLSHSAAAAALIAAMAAMGFVLRGSGRAFGGRVFACLFLAMVSHPLLDMLTDGGLGVALWAPFSSERHFFGWTPIPVSPIGVGHGLMPVFQFEALVFGPFTLIAALASRMMAKWRKPTS